MAIDRLFTIGKRTGVAWLGTEPPADARAVFEERGFLVNQYNATDLLKRGYVEGLACVVFTQDKSKPNRIANELSEHAQLLLDCDCRVVIRAVVVPELNGLVLINRALKGIPSAGLGVRSTVRSDPPLPHARIYSIEDHWPMIANFLMEHQPGAGPNLTLTIEPVEVRRQLRPDYQMLVQRAFWDCSEVYLKRMDDGQSGVLVYLAHPELSKGQMGHLAQWPLPYFLKVGKREKVFEEFVNYEDHVDPYIPFHLGPHLIRERCCLGARAGLIVGDFVEESESLIDCASSGRAAPAIACLFNRTLAGWHRGAQVDNQNSSQLGKSFLCHFPRMKDGMQARLKRARDLGATKTLDELRMLFQKCKSLPVLVGAIHGDLHAGNVMVRATDAIVIDFFAHKMGPLVYDAACLEASLLVDGFEDLERFESGMAADILNPLDIRIQKWMRSVETLYNDVALRTPLMHPNPKNPSCWFHACVRQIRLFARQMEAGDHQYAAVLAVALLKKATKDLNAAEPEASKRAVAYVMAERVLLNTFST